MKVFTYPYTKYLVSPPRLKKPRYVYRPVIPIHLSFGSQSISFDALIDSGADECTFPGWVAKALGKDVHKGKEKIFSGIGGSVLSYLHKTKLSLEGIGFNADVYYSHEWDDMPFGLLGQSGFFSRFEVKFCYKEKFIQFKHR